MRMRSCEWITSGKQNCFPVLAALTVDARAFEDLTGFLATSPPWRTWFLSQLSARLANQARLIQLYAALNKTEKPPTKQELRPYLDRLIKDGNFDQAQQTWQSTLSPEQRASETYPFNRDFNLPLDGLPFNWNLETVPGAEIQIVSCSRWRRKIGAPGAVFGCARFLREREAIDAPFGRRVHLEGQGENGGVGHGARSMVDIFSVPTAWRRPWRRQNWYPARCLGPTLRSTSRCQRQTVGRNGCNSSSPPASSQKRRSRGRCGTSSSKSCQTDAQALARGTWRCENATRLIHS